MSRPAAIHATCILVGASGVLLRGRPGSGKSTLALGLLQLDTPALAVRLVADDCVELTPAHGRIVASAPETITGLVEVRGTGLVPVPCIARAVLRLVADLRDPALAERLPETEDCVARLCGINLPRITVAPGVDAPARLLATLRYIAEGGAIPALGEPIAFGLETESRTGPRCAPSAAVPPMRNPR